jgi:1-acyl-sn-glycerol-3-phosphate acyltransferase
MKLLLKIYSAAAWLTMLITSVIITPFFLLVWVLTFWWDRRRIAAHMMGTFWAWHYQSLVIFWKLRLEGREKIPWNRPVVIVANHRSLVDILALYKIRRPFKWVSKAENFRLPFIGMVLSLTNCIKVNRKTARSGMQFLTRAEEEMRKGSSVLIFPEGTRSRDSGMRKFRDGAFVLAKKMQCGIVPVVHTGSEKTFPKGKGWWILQGRTTIRIRVLDEIPGETVKAMETEALKHHTYMVMKEALAAMEHTSTTDTPGLQVKI